MRIFIFPIEAFIVIFIIGWGTLKRPSLGLGLFIAFLPILSLTRKIFYYETIVPFPSLESIAAIFLLSFVILYSFKNKKNGNKYRAFSTFFVTLSIAIFLSAGFISSILSPDMGLSLKFLFTGGIIPIIIFEIASKWIQNKQDCKYLIFSIFALAGQTILYSIYQSLSIPDIFALSTVSFQSVYSQSPVTGLFVVPFVTSSVIISAIPISAWYHRYGRFLPNLLWVGLTFGVLFVGILSFSRGVWVAYLGIVVASLSLIFGRIRFGRLFFSFMLVISLAYLFSMSPFFSRILDFRSFSLGDASLQNRIVNYSLVIKSIPTYFFYGVGLGQYPLIYKEFPLDIASYSHHLWFAHSLLLTLIAEVGFLGFLGFIGLFIEGIGKGIKSALWKLQSPQQSLIYALCIGIVFSFVINSSSGTHLVAYIDFTDPSRTYFMAPEMIIIFAQLGAVRSLTIHKNILEEDRAGTERVLPRTTIR